MVILDCELRDPPWITLERNYIKTGPVTALKKWAQFSYELSENSNEFDPISPGSNSFPEDYTVKSAECIFAMDPFPIEIPHQMFHLGSLKLGVHSNESITSKFSSNQIISLFFFWIVWKLFDKIYDWFHQVYPIFLGSVRKSNSGWISHRECKSPTPFLSNPIKLV